MSRVDVRWVDTHAHVERYGPAERPALLLRAAEAGVAVVSVGTDVESSRIGASLPGVAGALAGVHPRHAEDFDARELAGLLARPGVIAVGECGFDGAGPNMDIQSSAFAGQARLARALGLPIVLHIDGPGAFEALAGQGEKVEGLTIIRHYFTGDEAEAQWHAERGHYLSFGNPIRREPLLREIARVYPEHLLLVETDSYPLPKRKTEPRDVGLVAESLASVRAWSLWEASQILRANTLAAFPRLEVVGSPGS